MSLFNKLLKKAPSEPLNKTQTSAASDDESIDEETLNLSYKKIPMTPELQRRKEEEILRKKYNAPKTKDGTLL